MSDELDNLDIQKASTHKPGPLTPEQKAKKQARFIKVYRECGNIKHSCKAAGISRQTFYDWRDNDEDFKAQLPGAKEDACDVLEFAAHERAVQGVLEPVVSQGQLVYEYKPMLDKEGKQTFTENGKPLMERGKQIMKRVYSDSLLAILLKANMPQKYRENKSVEMSGPNGGPIQTKSTVDLSSLTTEEITMLLAIAEKAEQSANET